MNNIELCDCGHYNNDGEALGISTVDGKNYLLVCLACRENNPNMYVWDETGTQNQSDLIFTSLETEKKYNKNNKIKYEN